MPAPWTPLILDTFVFNEARLETPETFGDVGGVQSIEQHDFPGGIRTQKSYGYFPSAQKWRAKIHGTDASERAADLKRIVSSGREVRLQFNDRAFLGRVAKFSVHIRTVWLVEYEIEFWPRIDYGAPGLISPPPTGLGSILALHLLSLQSLLTYGLSASLATEAMGAEIGGPIGELIIQVQGAVASGGGVIGNIGPDQQNSIYQQSLSALAATAPYQASQDPTVSSPASDAAARIQAIQTIMTASQPPVAVVRAVNPNLVVLASVYYGDASMWRTIASANGISDPQPIGTYALTIPQTAS